jgi:hypothetical protein
VTTLSRLAQRISQPKVQQRIAAVLWAAVAGAIAVRLSVMLSNVLMPEEPYHGSGKYFLDFRDTIWTPGRHLLEGGNPYDPEGYLAAARRSAVLGYEGKWAIHPSQIELANDVFTPAPRLVERTKRIVEAMRSAAAEGKGAVSLDGRLIDAASIRMAENLLAKLEQIEARRADEPPVRAAAS